MENKIDFVILWVDGNDEEWRKERDRYSGASENTSKDNREKRYRDWDNLKYLFRGIEKFAPWVNKVHFITCGHLPKWLNVKYDKLNIIKHSDYIPAKYLPTFNSDPIELNLHRIKDLSETFVIFNDDTFILNDVKQSDFFKDGKPCDAALLNVHCYEMENMFTLAPFVNIGIINKYFNMRNVLSTYFGKWFNPKYGINVLRNVYLLPCPRFPGMRMDHLPCSHLKSTFETIWKKEPQILDESSSYKFRSKCTVNHWLMKEWNICSGDFAPRNPKIGKSFCIDLNNANKIESIIKNKKYKLICLNDSDLDFENYVKCKTIINNAFDKILCEKSNFEI